MVDRTHDITDITGEEFQDYLIKLAGSEEWKSGKVHQFNFKIGKHTLTIFEIKAMKRQNPIEELLIFHQPQGGQKRGFSWDDAREFLDDVDFVPFYHNHYLMKRFNTLREDIQRMKECLKICFMLTFEIARCQMVRSDRNHFIAAITTALNTEADAERRYENITDLCKMFPKKMSTRIEDDRRQYALDCINRRKKMEQIIQINKAWPQGEDASDLLEILSKDPVERHYAFKKFVERKNQFENVLLRQDPEVLTYFESILTANDEEDARRAFDLLDIKKQAE